MQDHIRDSLQHARQARDLADCCQHRVLLRTIDGAIQELINVLHVLGGDE